MRLCSITTNYMTVAAQKGYFALSNEGFRVTLSYFVAFMREKEISSNSRIN